MTFGSQDRNGASGTKTATGGHLRFRAGFGDARRPSVMLVDDDPTLRTLLRLTLPSDDFDVTEAADGTEALERLEQQPFDVVVLDWNMPRCSGGEVLVELKRRGADIPVVVLTGERDVAKVAVARSLGAAAFLTKPFSPLRLLDEIERLVADSAPNQPA
jgi:CheY-like chemotaxis protein